jgi:hypothetical protein
LPHLQRCHPNVFNAVDRAQSSSPEALIAKGMQDGITTDICVAKSSLASQMFEGTTRTIHHAIVGPRVKGRLRVQRHKSLVGCTIYVDWGRVTSTHPPETRSFGRSQSIATLWDSWLNFSSFEAKVRYKTHVLSDLFDSLRYCCGYEEKQITSLCSGATSSLIKYLLPQLHHRYVM